ncbi:MAG TPA: TolC family protein [Longimicrobium sp.]|nr:TolC family protein [Longimicrobium sp.]
MRTIRILAAVALAALPLSRAAAQAEAPQPLTLQQALRIAEENNPAYRRAQTELGTSEADRRRTRGAFLPTLSLRFSNSGSYSRVFTGTGQFGEPVVRDDPLETRGSNSSQSLNIGGVTLFDGGQRLGDMRASRAGYLATEQRIETEGLRVRSEVTRRYFDALKSQRLIRLEEDLLKSAQDRLEVVRGLVRVGVRGPLDVLTSEVTVAEQEQALQRARGEARKTELDLRQSMGVLDERPILLVDEPPAVFDPSALDPQVLVARTLSTHPRVQRSQLLATQAGHRVRSARAARLPRLSLTLSAGRRQGFKGYDGLLETNPLDQSLSMGFDVSVPIFNQFNTSYQIQSARAQEVSAREDVRTERLQAERDVRGALIDLDNSYRAVQNAERSLQLNRRRLELAQQQYRVGALGLNDLTDAVEKAARAERDHVRVRFEFAASLAQLEEKLGGPLQP